MFEADPGSAAHVRKYVRDSLETWKVRSDEAVLLANELATNAIVHAKGDFAVEVSLNETTCRIEVVDSDPGQVREPPRNITAATGRGLALVRAMSSSWGVVSRVDGKGVWCDVDVRPRL
jgi:anti-sigma regulatory factor (Ser/Thr protein kinase)